MIHKLQVLVLAADLLERWTHGAVCSCRHRVRGPAQSAGRLSLVYDAWAWGLGIKQKEEVLTHKHGGVTNKEVG